MKKNNVAKQSMPYLVLILVIMGTLLFWNVGQTKVNKISYDELIANASNVSIGYMDENDNDDIVVKQVDLSCTGKIELDPIKKALNSRVSIATYDHEEEFLDALKQLNKLLN